MYYDVIPEKAPLFTAKFREVLSRLAQVPGHKATYLYQRVDDPASFAILSEWDDRQAFLDRPLHRAAVIGSGQLVDDLETGRPNHGRNFLDGSEKIYVVHGRRIDGCRHEHEGARVGELEQLLQEQFRSFHVLEHFAHDQGVKTPAPR